MKKKAQNEKMKEIFSFDSFLNMREQITKLVIQNQNYNQKLLSYEEN